MTRPVPDQPYRHGRAGVQGALDVHHRRLAELVLTCAGASDPLDGAAFGRAAARAYAERRREQRCPDCGREEAGGSYCTWCFHPVHPDDWTNDTTVSRAARAAHARRAGGPDFRAVERRDAPPPTDRPPLPGPP